MKAPRIIWPVLLMVTGFTCLFSWLTIPQPASQARIKIDGEGADIAGIAGHAAASSSGYDPYFIRVNDFMQILIPASSPK